MIKNEAFVEYDPKEFELKIKNHFMRCMLLDDLLTLDTPLCFQQINCPLIDKLDCFEGLTLKVASALGDIFDFSFLVKIIPFRDLKPP